MDLDSSFLKTLRLLAAVGLFWLIYQSAGLSPILLLAFLAVGLLELLFWRKVVRRFRGRGTRLEERSSSDDEISSRSS